MFDKEEVNEAKARSLAKVINNIMKEYNAIFKVVSAKSAHGVYELFHEIGIKILLNNKNLNESKDITHYNSKIITFLENSYETKINDLKIINKEKKNYCCYYK